MYGPSEKSQLVKIDSAKYTQGLLELSEELASLTDNYKVLEDYGMPGRIAVILRQIRCKLETGSGSRESIEKIKSDLIKVEKALKYLNHEKALVTNMIYLMCVL